MAEEHDLGQPVRELEALRFELAKLRQAEEARARAERALRESEARYRSLYNDTPVMLHSIDNDGRLVAVNDHWLRVMGYTRDEVLGRHVTDFHTRASRGRAVEGIAKLLAGEPRRDIEYRLVKRNGELIDVLLSATVERDDGGRIRYSLAVLTDITARKRAEVALRESEERLAGILRSAMDAVLLVDEAGTIRLFNPAAERIFGCAAAEACGGPVERFLSPEFRATLAHCFCCLGGNESARSVFGPEGLTAIRTTGEVFSVEATISSVDVGEQGLCTIILRDVEERKRAEDELRRLRLEQVYLREEIATEHHQTNLIGSSRALSQVLQHIATVAPSDSTVLVTGETGTGKELVARAIHQASRRRDAAMVTVNCAALSSGLIESEMFGHEKGAFTGAIARKIGRFELADGGTILLDEVGELSPEVQAKLLRVLQEGQFERVGGVKTVRVDVRVIAATNRDLAKAVADGRFRADLFYRLNVFPIQLPPLRERREDIPLVAKYFTAKYATQAGRRITTVSKKTLKALTAYDWPGNVRELQNIIERAVLLSPGPELELGDWFRQPKDSPDASGATTLHDLQRAHIIKVLERTGWQISGEGGAAKILGLKPTTLHARMAKLHIRRHGAPVRSIS
jgi:formate hydrogenlyase transcriptional activator